MHNVQFYLRPSDGRMLFFPHDMDAFYDASRTITPNGDLSKIIAVPTYARAYYSHLLEIMETTYNSTYMTRWANHFGALLPGQPFASHLAFITQRKNVVTSAVNGAVPTATLFAVTTNGGNDTTAPNSPVTLTGTANLTVKTIMVNGITYPITWTSRTAWSVSVPLASGANALSIQGVDRHGIPLGTALDTITVVNEGEGAPQPVKINEWMANNAGPGGLADPVDGQFQDWIELYNANLTPVDLSGYTLTDTLSQPSKWTFPVGTSISAQGFLLIWADNQTSQNTPDNGLHAAFQLGSGGEAIGLYNAAGVAQHTVNFGAQTENVSEGLFPNGNISSINSMPNWTPRYPNTLAGPFAILTSTVTAAGATITWTSIPGRIYRVEYSDTLTNPWSTLTPDVTATAETTSATETNGTTRRRFYRVRRLE